MFNWIRKIIYALPFGLKAADKEIMSADGDVSNGTGVHQQVTDKSMFKAMLRGEVTQEVEELRYRTYEVAKKSKEYEYVGNGVTVKKEIKRDNSKIRFTQPNKLITAGVLEELNHINDYGTENYHITLEYAEFCRFKVEAFISEVDVLIENDKAITKLHFSTLPDPYNGNSAPFINELKKIAIAKDSEYALNRNEIVKKIMTMSFITFNASNDEPDLVSYAFFLPKFIDYGETATEAWIEYEWGGYRRDDLSSKFYSPTMAKKYENHEKKDNVIDLNIGIEKRNCHICGEEIPGCLNNMADPESGKPICLNCLTKKIENYNKK